MIQSVRFKRGDVNAGNAYSLAYAQFYTGRWRRCPRGRRGGFHLFGIPVCSPGCKGDCFDGKALVAPRYFEEVDIHL